MEWGNTSLHSVHNSGNFISLCHIEWTKYEMYDYYLCIVINLQTGKYNKRLIDFHFFLKIREYKCYKFKMSYIVNEANYFPSMTVNLFYDPILFLSLSLLILHSLIHTPLLNHLNLPPIISKNIKFTKRIIYNIQKKINKKGVSSNGSKQCNRHSK